MFNLFNDLRRVGFSLSIDDYLLLLRAFECGFGLPDREALRRLCYTLWVKSEEDKVRFDSCFDQWQPALLDKDSFQTPIKHESSELIPHKLPLEDNLPPTPSPVQPPNKPLPDTPQTPTAMPTKPRSTHHLHEQVQQWVKGTVHRYSLRADYLPISERQAQQSWRYLRRPVREGVPVELDVEATVTQMAEQGFLLQPVLRPRRINRLELILLLDHDGSMMPFHPLLRRLKETLLGDNRVGQVYYFQNYPASYLYSVKLQQPQDLSEILPTWQPTKTAVLIVSDAGAARGGFNQERVEATTLFLHRLRQRVRRVVWLNPVPVDRWLNTSATVISQQIFMAYLDRPGLVMALHHLRSVTE